MCGICALGSENQINKSQMDIFKKILEATQIRGTDATGIAWHNKNKDRIFIFKSDNKAEDFIKCSNFPNNIQSNTLIGHCRRATQGHQSIDGNNHPVRYGNFVVVHNGIITNDHILFPEFKLKREAEVDSEIIPALIHHFHSAGKTIEESIQETSKKIRGNYACLLYHIGTPCTIWAFRYNNPMVFKNNELGIWISSTKEILSPFLGEEEIEEIEEEVIYKMVNNVIEKTEHKIEPYHYGRVISYGYECGSLYEDWRDIYNYKNSFPGYKRHDKYIFEKNYNYGFKLFKGRIEFPYVD